MFSLYGMQDSFDFAGGSDLETWHDRLLTAFGPQEIRRRDPVGQMVKSSISNRTLDAVSLKAYNALAAAYPSWPALAAASPQEILPLIAEVKFPEDKADRLIRALRQIGAEDPGYRLEFLRDWPVERALAWLEQLPGVARKVAASTLNFSTLARPAFVVDAHIIRIFARLGFTRAKADTLATYRAVMAAANRWPADALAEFHILLKLLGQTLCTFDHHNCARCPLAADCRTANG